MNTFLIISGTIFTGLYLAAGFGLAMLDFLAGGHAFRISTIFLWLPRLF